jgi:hypothetical protein
MTAMPDQDAQEFARRRKSRNRAMLVVLLGLAVLFYAMTVARMGGP